MEKELRRLLLDFDLKEVCRMSEAEIKARIEALQELGNGPHYLWRLQDTDRGAERRFVGHNGSANFSTCLLEEELRVRRAVIRSDIDSGTCRR